MSTRVVIKGLPSVSVTLAPFGIQRVTWISTTAQLLASVAPTPENDTTPSPFSFTDQTNVGKNQVITSNSVTPIGYNAQTTISVTGGEYEINASGVWRTAASTISPGQSVRVRHTSSGSFQTAVNTVLTIGGVSDTFTSTTVVADVTPSAFSFNDQTGATPNTTVTSNSITPTGYEAPAPISITGGEYEINGSGTWLTAASTIAPGQSVRVRHTSSAAFSTAVNTVLTIGGVSDTFTSTTIASDTTPNAFGFTDQTGVASSSTITSDSVTPTGFNDAAPISITGGEYELDASGTWLTVAGTINPGQSVRVRHTSSPDPETTVNTVLTIGGVSDTFSSTTAGAQTVFVAILGGQSNMEGRNGSSSRDPLVDTDVTDAYQFPGYGGTVNGGDPNYRTITSDITPLNSVDPYQGAGGFGADRVGPGEYICRQLLDDNPGAKVLLVPCAVGGTTITTGDMKWLSNATPGAGGSLFENMITHSNLAIAAAEAQWPGATIVPLIFFVQGEFDASQGADPANYLVELKNIISRARARITGAADAPFILGSMVPIKWLPDSATFTQVFADINRQHVQCSLDVAGCYYVRGPGDKTTGTEDFLHYSPIPFTRLQGRGLVSVLTDTVGPAMTNANTMSAAVDGQLSLPLSCDDLHATFHIDGGADAAQFEISDPYLTPVLRWVGNGTGPAAGDYVVGVRARDGAGNFGATQTITITVSSEVSPATFFTASERGMVWDYEDGNVFQNVDGTVAAAVGDPVGWVRDQSPNNNHWVAAANNTTRPILRVDADGLRYLEFDGVDDILFASTPFIQNNNGVFTVVMGLSGAAASSPNRTVIGVASTSSNTPFVQPIQALPTGALTMNMRNDSSASGGSAPSLAGMLNSTKHVVTSQYEGGGFIQRMRDAAARPAGGGYGNYTEVDQGTFANGFTLTRAALGGRGFATPDAYFPGKLYPGFAINRVITELEIKNGEDWTATRTLVAALP